VTQAGGTKDIQRIKARNRLGKILTGRYRLDEIIAMGGMATVYRASHSNGHLFAVKVLHQSVVSDSITEKRFRREAEFANLVKHPGIVPVLDNDILEDGSAFLAMPLIEGKTLREIVVERGTLLPISQIVKIACDVLNALHAAHSKGIVHCDIKPENVMMTPAGEAKILDFGIARFFDSSNAETTTHSGRATGTPAYMAPEQARGEKESVDVQTDIWAVGALLFWLITGRFVHEANTPDEMISFAASWPAHKLREIAPETLPEIARIVDKALLRDKAQRWGSAFAMRSALLAVDTHPVVRPTTQDKTPLPVTATRDVLAVERPRSNRRSRVIALMATLATTVAGGAIVVGIRGNKTPQESKTNPNPALAIESQDSNVILAYSGGQQYWREASILAARNQFADAAQLEPKLGDAHLRYVALSEWTDPQAREHLNDAKKVRPTLSDKDKDLLDALTPAVIDLHDVGVTLSRLRDLNRKYPSDFEIQSTFALHLVHTHHLEEALKEAKAISSQSNVAFGDYIAARAYAEVDDLKGLHASLNSCLKIAPGSGDCRYLSTVVALNEGECARAERESRLWNAALPKDPDPYFYLAESLTGLGRSPEEIRSVFEQWWHPQSAADRPIRQCRDEGLIALLAGNFKGADEAFQSCETAPTAGQDAYHQGLPRLLRWQLARELGDRKRTTEFAKSYIAASSAWNDSENYDTRIDRHQLEYISGIISAETFARRRDEWLAEPIPPEHYFALPGVRWYQAYAFPAKTVDDAKVAMAHLPTSKPIIPIHIRHAHVSETIGAVFLLAGDLDSAQPMLNQAAHTCTAASILSVMRARYLLGTLYEAKGNVPAACEAYGSVLAVWKADTGSQSARLASENRKRLQCDLN